MITKYDISTKDKDVSYIEFVDMILDRLGFRRNNVGTRFLREFVIYLYKKWRNRRISSRKKYKKNNYN